MAAVDLEWTARRACDEGVEPELFFPPSNAYAEEAKSVCRSCQVAADCLTFALAEETRQDYGVWGGMTESERAALLRRRARKRTGGTVATVNTNPPTPDARCGTYAGARAHSKRAEWWCDDCREARSLYEMDRKAKVKAALQQEAS